jgi:hypothetical protein
LGSQALQAFAGAFEAKAAGLSSGRAGRLAATAGPAVPASLQLLLPSTPWDWPTDSNGTSSAELYEFCSWMPASSGSSASYTPSTTRFSDAYGLFLGCLQPDGLTSQASASFANSRYYTMVLYAEAPQQSMPAWIVSQFPQAWLASVSGGSSTEGTIRVPLPAAGEQGDAAPNATCFGIVGSDGTDQPVPLRAGQGQYVDIHADAWGMISVRPSGWYNGALVAVKAAGPYTSGGANVFFGPNGALRNLLTGMFVALNPTVTASIDASFGAQLQEARTPGTTLRVGGLLFDSLEVSEPADAGSLVSLTAASVAPQRNAVIVGVTVAPLGGSG